MARNLYITGFIVPTNIMRRYLEGHGNVFDDLTLPITSTRSSTSDGGPDKSDDVEVEEEEDSEEEGGKEDEEDDEDAYRETEEMARAMHEIELFHRYICCFRRTRRAAPPELRTRLEMLSTLKVEVDPRQLSMYLIFLFIQTGAFRKYQRGHMIKPTAQDELAIATFIDASNRLLPDDETRAKVGFRREDMQFGVAASGAIRIPVYMDHEREVRRRCFS
ncbi:hypothetical protein C8Q74DRAFT_17484 [Fomes fomentarius]|nr:hypothetical protein C8Q74DRAFT_17484 [Fomes fomentarius]